jgi:hypothetical protein
MSEAAAIVVERKDLLVRTESLIREFHPQLSAGAVITTVTRCRDELVRAGVRAGLATAAESMARARLRAREVPALRLLPLQPVDLTVAAHQPASTAAPA